MFSLNRSNPGQSKDSFSKSFTSWLTDLAMEGRPHSVLSSLVLCNRPCESTFLSRTSTPKTLGFMGLGYFCMAALVTVSHGWLSDRKKEYQTSAKTTNFYDIMTILRGKSDLSNTFSDKFQTKFITHIYIAEIVEYTVIHKMKEQNNIMETPPTHSQHHNTRFMESSRSWCSTENKHKPSKATSKCKMHVIYSNIH